MDDLLRNLRRFDFDAEDRGNGVELRKEEVSDGPYVSFDEVRSLLNGSMEYRVVFRDYESNLHETAWHSTRECALVEFEDTFRSAYRYAKKHDYATMPHDVKLQCRGVFNDAYDVRSLVDGIVVDIEATFAEWHRRKDADERDRFEYERLKLKFGDG